MQASVHDVWKSGTNEIKVHHALYTLPRVKNDPNIADWVFESILMYYPYFIIRRHCSVPNK